MRRKWLTVSAVMVALVVLPGCVGQTEFATDLSLSAATLNARGQAGPQGTEVYFEYWPSSNPAAVQETTHRQVAANAAGAFDERVTGLSPGTDYSFRVCGVEGGGSPLCAQVRGLRTGGDSVRAWGATSTVDGVFRWLQIDVNAVSGESGENPSGRIFSRVDIGTPPNFVFQGSETNPNVTCVNIDGNVAVVGFTDPDGDLNFAKLEDNGPAGSNLDRYFALPNAFYNRLPGDCSLPLPASLGEATMTSGDVAINDTEPQPTLR